MNSGAEGSIFEGLRFKSFLSLGAANVTVKRSWVEGSLTINKDSCIIEGCYLNNFSHKNANGSEPAPVGTIIRNSRLRVELGLASQNNGNLTIDHCVFLSIGSGDASNVLGFVNGSVRNTILDLGTDNFSSSIIFNDCLYLDGTPPREVNADSATREEAFVLFSEAPEGFPPFEFARQFELKSASPALTGDSNGGQQGLFGGSTPLVHGFHPAVPRITNLRQLSANPPNGITIEVTAQSQD